MRKATLRNWLPRRARIIAGLSLVLFISVVVIVRGDGSADLPSSTFQRYSDDDVLAYTVTSSGSQTSLMLYQPRDGTHVPVHVNTNNIPFSFGRDGRLAFSSGPQGHAQLYVLDTLKGHNLPFNISANPKRFYYPLAWSPDGRYLAFQSHRDRNNRLIHPWDGKNIVNITPKDVNNADQYSEVSWSPDGRLAFTTFFFAGTGDYSEIYLWDGKNTTSLSQNPKGEDRAPVWSADGRLAFLSYRNGEYRVFVWDGVSVKNGSPEPETFTKVAPKLNAYYSFPEWTDKGLLAFGSQSLQERYAEIYLWDGQKAINISQNPTMHNVRPTWSTDGRWAFSTTYYSPDQLVYVRAADNKTLFTSEGNSPAWSSSGYLMFCTFERPYWVLSLWDGKQIVKIAQGQEIWAQWQSGSANVCSSG